MKFEVIPNQRRPPKEGCDVGYLWTDNWNDWFEFRTLYSLTYFDAEGEEHHLGGVKIGQFNMAKQQSRPTIPQEFVLLDDRFFSLGQDADYYENVRALDRQVADDLLSALKDVVADEELYFRAKSERVMGVSLMRSVGERTLVGQFRRILGGGARLTSYSFGYRGPAQLDKAFDPLELSFSVEPSSKPPTNIQVIIGRNGVGKSFLLNAMSRALVYPEENVDEDGEFSDEDGEFFDGSTVIDEEFESPFANVVSLTFSAFDDFPVIRDNRNALKGVRYTNVGLRKLEKDEDDEGNTEWITITQDPIDLTSDFIGSAKICARGEKRERWLRALRMLESDPLFEEAAVADLLDVNTKQFGRMAGQLFRSLSSGHKIVLLTTTKLVEKVEERTLVLMDEPEAHLHPPLLAALIRALSDLLINRNGVAIVATHSPVVLQEVPKSCVWKIRRHGGGAIAERPRTETFAEHVGHLTHEVFGLEVTRSGFHKMIAEAIGAYDEFEDVVAKFGNELGSEGRALISMLLAQRDAQRDEEID
ncbi:ATP-dependent endonuclease [Pelagibius sp.]|uniref:ATP-dependent nuclease n=1 Tax=Pelagibius sp. TaxID=1931238 RepID=UPI00262A198A|nr:AAA family ATPase [Pelagibius sp.]